MTTSSVALPRPTHHGSTAVTGLVIAVASALAFSSSGPFVKPLLDGGWSLGAFLYNLENKRRIATPQRSPIGMAVARYTAPQTYGVRFSANF